MQNKITREGQQKIKTTPLIFSHEAKQPVNMEPSMKISFLIINYLFVMKILNPLFYLSPQWRISLTCVSMLHVFASLVAQCHVPANFQCGCRAFSVVSDIVWSLLLCDTHLLKAPCLINSLKFWASFNTILNSQYFMTNHLNVVIFTRMNYNLKSPKPPVSLAAWYLTITPKIETGSFQ